MIEDILSVRELERSDIELIASYWLNSETSHLTDMGVDINKLPTKEQFTTFMEAQIELPIEQKQSYFVIWERNNIPIGHSNTRPTNFGKEAYMHLHLWKSDSRKKGLGYEFVKLTLPYFFENLKLKDLFCEPFALNPAPNKTMKKAGFESVKEFTSTPGPFNFEQKVRQWYLSYDNYRLLYKTDT